MEIPQTLTAGDLWTWTDSQPDYPAPTWVLSYHFRGPKAFTLTATASGSDHVTSYTAALSSDAPRGTYNWIARAVNGTTVATLAQGRLIVQPNLANLAGDHRSHSQKVLDALTAVIENRASTDQLSLSIAGRSLSRMSWDELLAAYDRYKIAVAREMGLRPDKLYYRTARV